jgi:maltose O-acetyltransferase
MIRSILPEGRLYVANVIVANLPCVWLRMLFYRHVMKFDLGEGATIFMGSWFYCAGGLTLGDRSTINEKCRLDTRGGINIGHDVNLAAGVTVLTADHDPADPDFDRARTRGVEIGAYAFVATHALILPGVKLGRGCMVGAGSVVTKNVDDYTIVAGNPARPIGSRPENLSFTGGYRRLFH